MTDPAPLGIPDDPMLVLPDPVEVAPMRWRLEPIGEIDMSNAASLTAACAPVVDLRGVTLEIDLEGLTYIDSSGIGALVGIHHALESHGSSIQVVNSSGIVGRVLELSGLLPLLGEEPS
jgi:anti-anti-sigma factor